MRRAQELRRESHDEAETGRLAAALGGLLAGGEVIALTGPLGSGKTCFVRGLAAGLGIDPAEVSSPSFVICREHRDGRGVGLVHIDAYRLSGPQDLDAIGWDELLEDPHSAVVIEWAERVAAALPPQHVDIALEHVAVGKRLITATGAPALLARWVEAMEQRPEHPATRCPICGAAVARDGPAFPFCSARCRLVDLGRWLGESYRIGR